LLQLDEVHNLSSVTQTYLDSWVPEFPSHLLADPLDDDDGVIDPDPG